MTRQTQLMAAGLIITAALAWTGPLQAGPLTVSAAKAQGGIGKEVTLPIAFKGVKDAKNVAGLQMRVTFDPAILTFKKVEPGPALSNALVDKNSDEANDPGHLGLGFICGVKTAGSKEIATVDDDGIVLKLVFLVNEKATSGQKSPVKLDNFFAIDSAEPPSELLVLGEDGEITVGMVFPWLWIWVALGVLAFLILLFLIGRRKSEPARPAMTHGAVAGVGAGTFCSQCGATTVAGAPFCAGCGHKLSIVNQPAPRLCPQCRRPVPAGKKFCSFDGARVE